MVLYVKLRCSPNLICGFFTYNYFPRENKKRRKSGGRKGTDKRGGNRSVPLSLNLLKTGDAIKCFWDVY